MKTLYAFEGIVRKGNQRGRDLGFPTANIELSLEIPSGIYISFVTIDDVVYPSLTFVGEAKTFHLVIQMKEDETNARKFFAKLPNVRSM
jgi:FAD synthase